MSSAFLFGAGAIITFIALWGVVMAGGFYATRHQPPDDELPNVRHNGGRPIGAVLHERPAAVDHPPTAPAAAS